MRNMTVLLVMACGLSLATAALAQDVPLSRVVLFSSGVGYFEREGAVQGDATVELSFRTEQINDILKSLVLQDLSGGTIAPVTYAPSDPLERTLSAFSVNIADNPSVSDLWDRLRGVRVRVDAEKDVEGVVFGAEEQEKSVGDKVMTYSVLNLMTDKGLVSVPLWQVGAIKVLDEKIAGDLRKALAAVDAARDNTKRPVVLSFKGEGKRQVQVGYLLETPVWKTSYRLVTDKDGMLLQGWAIVENTTDNDWDNVGLSLVSGRPVSFIQDLYQPLYLGRPEVPVSVAAAARPRVFEGAMEREADEAAPAPEAAKARRASGARGDKADLGPAGGMGRSSGGMGGGMMGGMMGGMPGMAAATANYADMDLMASGAAAMAQGGKVGTLFQYAINQPVTIPRQRSAMIPIITSKVEGERVSVFNAAANAQHPMNGIRLKNSTGLHLMGGPITVFADNIYGGDALIEDVAPGDERLLTYAMDLAVEVAQEAKATDADILSVKVVRGVMTVQFKTRTEVLYTIKNAADEKRTVIIEHPLKPDWVLVEPKEAGEKTRSMYRFSVAVEPGKTEKLTVIEDLPRMELVRLADTGEDEVKMLMVAPKISEEVKAALGKLATMQAELAALSAQRDEKETRIKEIEEEQDRIRQNMKELDRQSQLYKDYVEKFTAQEAEFEKLREEIRALRGQEDAKLQAIQDYIENLDTE